jgi:hypothetical protein
MNSLAHVGGIPFILAFNKTVIFHRQIGIKRGI